MKKVKNYIFFGIYLLLNPRLFKLALHRLYIPVYVQYEWLKDYDIKTVIDVGAYRGQVSQVLNYLFPKAMIYAFEPIEESAKIILKSYPSEKIIVENLALSNRTGVAIFYKNYYLPSSSLLPLKQPYKKRYRLKKKIKVKTTTLDSYFKGQALKKHVFLKIDVQGNEGLVLEGGKNFIKKVSVIHIETASKRQYKGQQLFAEIYNYLTDLGFEYSGAISDSEFYPSFKPLGRFNAIFINSSTIKKVS